MCLLKIKKNILSQYSMNITFVLLLLILCLGCNRCYAYSGIIPPDPDNPGKCIYRGDELKNGETQTSSPCQQLTCHQDGSISIEGCGKVRIEKCNYGDRINLDKPYPECCLLKYKCKNPDGSSYYIEKNMAAENSST